MDIAGYVKLKNGDLAEVKRVKFSVAASQTDSALVSAVSGAVLRVISMHVMTGASGPTNFQINTKPGGAGTAISPVYPLAANGGINLDHNPHGYYVSSSGEGLTITTGAGDTCVGNVLYVEDNS